MTILFILLLIKYFFVIIKVKVSRSGVIMTNKYRLKIIYKDTKLTLDIEENITFDELSSIINEKLMLVIRELINIKKMMILLLQEKIVKTIN